MFFWKFDAYFQNTFFEEHLWETTSVFYLNGFFPWWKISAWDSVCSFNRKIIFTWWIISIVICRRARVIKIKWLCHWRNKSWSHREVGKSCRGVAGIAVLNDPWFMVCDIMINSCDTVCVRCTMFRCKPYIVSLNVLSWCSSLSSSFSSNFCSSDVPNFCSDVPTFCSSGSFLSSRDVFFSVNALGRL